MINKQVKIYAENLDKLTLEQFNTAMKQDFSVKGALMPDAHLGYSLPIGAVIATKDIIVPSWIGYDIGCGVCAMPIPDLVRSDVENNSQKIFDLIYEKIPVGFNINKNSIKYPIDGLTLEGRKITLSKKYQKVLGSLGGGNHFIEIGYDEKDQVWVIIHSGSRGVGHSIAKYYMTIASSNVELLEEEFDKTHKDLLIHNPDKYDEYKRKYIAKKCNRLRPKEGHYGLDVNSIDGQNYIKDLNWCLDFALSNRREMLSRVLDIFSELFNNIFSFDYYQVINRNHNHAIEKDGLWIHRKGATHAEEGMSGVIPGNMKDGSFIVLGKGNPDSLYSSSHGAGRVFSRKKAKELLKIDDFEKSMLGIKAKIDEDTLDESPSAYKDIFEVMRLQSDLVEVVSHIKPLINIKG